MSDPFSESGAVFGDDSDRRVRFQAEPTTAIETGAGPQFASIDHSSSNDETLEIAVTEPNKRGEGMDAHVVYRVTTKTSMPAFRYRDFYCFRRFKDFDYLYSKLAASHPGVIVPPLPDKGVIDRFGPGFEKNFIEARRAELERFLKRVSRHPILRKSPAFATFLQATDDEWTAEMKVNAPKSRGLFDMFKAVKTTLTTSQTVEDWFEAAKQHATVLDTHLVRQTKLIENLHKCRQASAQAMHDTGIGFISLASGVHNQELFTALKHVGEAAEAVGKDEMERADRECFSLEDMFTDNTRFVGSTKETIKSREKMLNENAGLMADTASAQANHEKLRMRGDRKTLEAKSEAEEALRLENENKTRLDEVTAQFQSELRRFDQLQASDFKGPLRRFVRSRVTAYRASAELWEACLPDIEHIPSTGGMLPND